MTRLKHYRKKNRLKLWEVAEKIGVTAAAVHNREVNGILTPRLAAKYAAAFPGTTWQDLLEPPRVSAGKQ